MADKIWTVLIRVTGQTNLSTVISALDGAGEIVEVKEVKPEEGAPAPKVRATYAHGKRSKGISGDNLIKEIFNASTGPVTQNFIENEFVKRGFARTTTAANIGIAVRAGFIRNIGAGKFEKIVHNK